MKGHERSLNKRPGTTGLTQVREAYELIRRFCLLKNFLINEQIKKLKINKKR